MECMVTASTRPPRPVRSKASQNPDITDKKRHPLLWRANGANTVNERFHQAVLAMPQYPTRDSIFRLTFAHVSRGHYPKNSDVIWHEHSDHQIELVLAGEFHFETLGVAEVLLPGDALMIFPLTEHRWSTSTGGVMLGIDLHRAPMSRMLRVNEGGSGSGILAIRSPLVRSAATVLCEAVMGKNFTELDLLAADGGLSAVVAAILAASHPSSCKPSESSHRWADAHEVESIERTCRFLRDNLSRNISASELGKVSGLTHRHLNRLFKKLVGSSLHQFLIEARLVRAEELLRNGGLLVKEVAYACGFSSPSHLSCELKKRHKVLPSKLTRNPATAGN